MTLIDCAFIALSVGSAAAATITYYVGRMAERREYARRRVADACELLAEARRKSALAFEDLMDAEQVLRYADDLGKPQEEVFV